MTSPHEIIAIASTKGGVGKTSIAFHMAGSMAHHGYNVLVCDVDAQADLTGVFANQELEPSEAIRRLEQTSPMYRTVIKDEPAQELIQPTHFERISLLGSGMDLYDWEEPLRKRMSPERRLSKVLVPVRKEYDVIIIDCPPAPNKAMQMALVSATGFLVPVDASAKSVVALRRVLRLAEDARSDGGNRDLRFLGAVFNKFQARTNLDKYYCEVYAQEVGERFLATHVPFRKPYQEAHTMGEPITLKKPESELSDVFKQLLAEIDIWQNSTT